MKKYLMITTFTIMYLVIAPALAVWKQKGGEFEKALTLKPDTKHGKQLFGICAACHLPEGWGRKDGSFPQLAGQHKEVLLKQLSDIRAGNRDNPTMYPFTLPESIGGPQALADIVGYIEKLPMTPDNGKGKWPKGTPEYTQGKKLFETHCVRCHGPHGEGDAKKFYPRIQGQHYAYMLRQFKWIEAGKRRNADPDMMEQIKNFTDKEQEMVINYVSRIPVPNKDLAPSNDSVN